MPFPEGNAVEILTWLRQQNRLRPHEERRFDDAARRPLSQQPDSQNQQHSHHEWHHCLKGNQHGKDTVSKYVSTLDRDTTARNCDRYPGRANSHSYHFLMEHFVPRGHGYRCPPPKGDESKTTHPDADLTGSGILTKARSRSSDGEPNTIRVALTPG